MAAAVANLTLIASALRPHGGFCLQFFHGDALFLAYISAAEARGAVQQTIRRLIFSAAYHSAHQKLFSN